MIDTIKLSFYEDISKFDICLKQKHLGYIDFLSGCTVNGKLGDGTKQGTCKEQFLCYSDGICIHKSTIRVVHGKIFLRFFKSFKIFFSFRRSNV